MAKVKVSLPDIPANVLAGMMNNPDGYCSICGKEIKLGSKPPAIYEQEMLCKVHFECYTGR